MNIQNGLIIAVASILFMCLIYALCSNSLSTASFMLYGDATFIPKIATVIITITMFVPLVTYKYWSRYLEDQLIDLVGSFRR